jgi:tetraacyldisaccharide 4'-kinase
VGGLLWRSLFFAPSLLFEGVARARAAAYRCGILETVRVPVPVFCMGNLTVGGAGKTPGVLWLLEELKKRGHRPAVVTRGYGRRGTEPVVLVPSAGEALPPVELIGDEPRLVARRSGVPLSIGADRALACERAWEEFKPDCLVMDDGFQHHRIHRDRDFVCIDARQAFDVLVNHAPVSLLPAGPWRERPKALGRAHMVFVTRAERLSEDRVAAVRTVLNKRGIANGAVGGRLTFRDDATGQSVPGEWFNGQRVVALSGLGDPSSFENALVQLGATVRGERYRDHHFFSPREWSGVLAKASREGCRVVVTEKDRERLPESFPALVARLEWHLLEEVPWVSVIESVFS